MMCNGKIIVIFLFVLTAIIAAIALKASFIVPVGVFGAIVIYFCDK